EPVLDSAVRGRRFRTEAGSRCAAGSEKRRLVPISAALKETQTFIEIVGVHEAEYRAENFCVGDLAAGRDVIEDRWLDEVAAFVFWDAYVTSVEQNFCALAFACSDQGFNARFALGCDDGPHLHAFIQSVADFEFRGG